MFRRIYDIILLECWNIWKNPVYLLSMIVFPVLVMVYFTSMMNAGQPQELPVGIVDLDNSATSRAIVRRLDAMQTTNVVRQFSSVAEARKAVQKNEIYAFMYIPEGTTANLMANRQPKISLYYSSTSLLAGALLFRDMKTVATLANAAVGQTVLRAKGFTDAQTMAFLQPISLDAHLLNNPCVNYNQYLSTMLIPACIMLFIMLLTTYTLGMELKQQTARRLMEMAGGNAFIAVLGKLIPQTLTFLTMMFCHVFYLYGALGFFHQGSLFVMLLVCVLAVLAAQGFGVMIFALLPSMRLSMSVCSLWGVLSFSMVGTAFPAFAMDAPLRALTVLFPMRHYWLMYSVNIFNGYSLSYTWINILALALFALFPIVLLKRMKRVFMTYNYME